MATYKVLQDIEAEDKLVGPLSFRQCVYAGAAVFLYYISYLLTTKHAAFLLILFLPPALFCTFFAIPWQSQQSTEVWALAKIRFFFKARQRVWDQSGVKELVTITVPKHIEINYTDGLSQSEVTNRLKALAETIDSRGWAIKNVPMNVYNQPVFGANVSSSDRLIDIDDFAQEVPSYDVSATQDVLDTQNNPIAKQFDQMMDASRQAQRRHIKESMIDTAAMPPAATHVPAPGIATQGSSAVPYWFTDQYGNQQAAQPSAPGGLLPQVNMPPTVTSELPQTVSSVAAPLLSDESALLQQLHTQDQQQALSSAHMRTIQPLGQPVPQRAPFYPEPTPPAPVTPHVDPAILELANNNDLNIATIARQANKYSRGTPDENGEVVISLH
jgi:hypothetical protein